MINLEPLENDDKLLGFYLIPPPNLTAEMIGLRNLVYDQYRIKAASKFMTHMTIKGFFKPVPNIRHDQLIQALDGIIERYRPFTIYPTNLKRFGDVGIAVEFSREKNDMLWRIHNDCYQVIEPFIAVECDSNLGEDFTPHLTISMVDVSSALLEDMSCYLSDIQFDLEGYVIKNFKLYEFTSRGWGTKDWIYTLEWKILHSWQLQSKR